jgi:ERCC4-type nuclease
MTAEITILVDSREQLSLSFDKFRGVNTVRKGLRTGDYSISGYEDVWTCERKSVSDLVGTLCQGRERFERELDRMRVFEEKYLLIEHSPSILFSYCMKHGWIKKFDMIIQSLHSFQHRYGIQVRFCKDRDYMAEYIVKKAKEFLERKNEQSIKN